MQIYVNQTQKPECKPCRDNAIQLANTAVSIPEKAGALGKQQAAEFSKKGMIFFFPLIWEHEFTEPRGSHKIWKSVVFVTGCPFVFK